MPDEELRVEVELGGDDHHWSLWERLKALDLDDDARKRLGSQVTVTRDGNRVFLYTHTLADAQEAERTVRELAAADGLGAEVSITRWDADAREWTDLSGAPVSDDETEEPVGIPDPRYVALEAYKPEFLRDLGL